MKLQNTASWMIIAVVTFVILFFGKNIILPFIIALLIWFVVKKMRNLIDKSHFIHKYIPTWFKSTLAALLVIGIIFLVARVLTNNIENLSTSYKSYASNIELISKKISELFEINIHEEMTTFYNEINKSNYLQSIFNSISEILSNMVLIIFYVVFLIIEESLFKHKIKLMFRDKDQFERVNQTMMKMDQMMSSYISLKSIVSLITTSLSYFILLGVGIDSPLFWAFLIFILNFIPSVGPILGAILPSLFSLIQFGEFVPFFVLILGIGGVSTLVGSLVEPKLLGNTLNISPLVAVISLAIWGSLWGVIGMLLSVPITVALIIVFAQFPQTRPISILLSERGRV